MKIRIKGNSLRLRLTQSEVQTFGESGSISEQIQFGSAPEASLEYSLQAYGEQTLEVRYAPSKIRVLVPMALARDWVQGNAVGMESEMPIDGATSLSILIEKDFKCLSKREGEDETDMFPNPDAELHC